MKTGFGSHSRPEKMLAPRSVDGADEVFRAHEHVGEAKPKSTVKIHAPTKPALECQRFKSGMLLLTMTYLPRSSSGSA